MSEQELKDGGWTTRRAPHMERFVEVRPVVIEEWPDAHNVFLKVGVQQFCVSPHGCETRDEAEWMRDMLCIALDAVVSATRPSVAAEQEVA